MIGKLMSCVLAAWVLGATPVQPVRLDVRFEAPATAGADGAIAVLFVPTESGIVVNETPAPRLKLDPQQAVLVDKQPPRAPASAPADPSQAKYLDPRIPVRFAVAWAPAAPRGAHVVRASVTFFYCSKPEGWCKKGTSEVAVDVNVP